jgi:hypothetical protein
MTQYIFSNNVPLVDKSQEFKEQVINNAILASSCLSRSVLTRTLTGPPATPVNESLYLIPATGTNGDWVDKGNQLVLYYNSLPLYFQPYEGLIVWVIDEQVWYNYHNGTWQTINTGTSGGSGGGSGGSNPLTALGDLYVGGAAGAPARLPKGDYDGLILQVDHYSEVGLSYTINTSWRTESVVTYNYTPGSYAIYPIDTTGGPVTITLPEPSADQGAQGFSTAYRFVDAKGTFATNNLTITPPAAYYIGNKAAGESITLNQNWSFIELRQLNSSAFYIVADYGSAASLF